MATQTETTETGERFGMNETLMNVPSAETTPAQLRSGIMRTWVLMEEYMRGDGQDKGLAWCVFVRKEEERQAWLELVPPRYVGAAACSLVREHLALELGHTHVLARLCAVTDDELEKAAKCSLRTELLVARQKHRAQFATVAPEVQVCAYWQCSALVVAPVLFEAGEVKSEVLAKNETLACAGCNAAYCGRECQSRDMAHFEAFGAACKKRVLGKTKGAQKKSATRRTLQAAFALNPVLKGMLRCGLGQQVFAAPAPVPPLEQVAAWLLKAWEQAPVHDLYARMQKDGDFDGVGLDVVREAMQAGRVTALVLASKGLYMQLHAAWKARVLALYELQVTWMHWGVRAQRG